MVCGNAAGRILLLYVVYKSSQLWNTWTERGPVGCRYHHTPSGWFDSLTFNDFFEGIMIPALRKLSGKKVIICDNLSTHLSVPILQRCQEENIHFVCFPPNSIQLTQPLDVSFFRPLKAAWRNTSSGNKLQME
jgi:hypothetical protein